MPVITAWPDLLAVHEGRMVEKPTWDPFFDRFVAYGQEPFRGDKVHPGWSAARFDPPARAKENVVAVTALVLDYDDCGTSFDEAVELWGIFFGFVHTTRRHAHGADRFRVVLPFSREISSEEYALLWRHAVNLSGHHVDEGTKDASRFWYVPGAANGGGFRAVRLGGYTMDPDPLLVEAREAAESAKVPDVTRIHPSAETRADKYAQGALDRACESVEQSSPGTRNNALFIAASSAGNFIAAGNLSEQHASERLETSARVCGLPDFEARRTIRSGIARGKQSPRQVPEDERATGTRQRPSPSSPADSSEQATGPDAHAPSAESPKKVVYQTLSEFVRSSLKPVGQRLETGLATLDEATRGGVPLGRVVVLAGAPGAAKTTLAAFLCDCWEKSGCAVVYLASDEPAEGIAIRLGQLAGFSRDALETEGDIGDAVRAGFAARAEGRPLVVLDPDENEDLSTIEAAEAVVLDLAGDRPRVLVVDSLQTARCAAADDAESAKERIDIKLRVIKAIAKRGTLVIAISEMARSGYRANNRADNVSALAAGKESGSIEYGASLLLGLRSVKGQVGQVDVEVAKNRLGGHKPDLRMQLDFDRASFREIALPTEGGDAEQAQVVGTAAKRMDRAKERVRECLRQHRDCKSQRAVLAHVDGARDANADALRVMVELGEVVVVDGTFRIHMGAT